MIPNHLSGVGAIAGSLRVAGRGRWCRTPRDGGRSPRPGCERPGEPGKQRRATDSARGPRKAGAPPTPILTSGTLKLRAVLGHCVRELCYSNSRSLIQKKEQVLFKMPQIPDSLAARGGRLLAMDVKQMGTGRGLQEGHCSATEKAGFSPPTQPACHVSSFPLGTQGETGRGSHTPRTAEHGRQEKPGTATSCGHNTGPGRLGHLRLPGTREKQALLG